NWWSFAPPSDSTLGVIELVLYYRNAAGTGVFVHTRFFASQLVATGDGWHHLAAVNDLGGNTLTFYVDGNQVYSTTALDVSSFGSGADRGVIKWTFVGNNTLLNNAWGSMDELYIFQRA